MTALLSAAVIVTVIVLHRQPGEGCQITDERIGGVRLGASLAEVVDALRYTYSVDHHHQSDSASSVVAHIKDADRKSKPAFIVWFNADRAFMIDTYQPCATREGVGPGMLLRRARDIYGADAELYSADAGYFVSFAATRRVMFLLQDSDLPKELRGIPDDVLTPALEKKVLAIGSAELPQCESSRNSTSVIGFRRRLTTPVR
jgi:hypothetical protein